MANNNYPQITSVTSESLQAQIRNLLPSQEGFGTDLMAQNVIVPIIDLTRAAEGSTVPQQLQTAIAFGSQTSFNINNTTTTIISNTGFYRIIGTATLRTSASAGVACSITGTDGLSTKKLWDFEAAAPAADNHPTNTFDFVIFVAIGQTISGVASSGCILAGSTRQIADINGNLINPAGFSPQ